MHAVHTMTWNRQPEEGFGGSLPTSIIEDLEGAGHFSDGDFEKCLQWRLWDRELERRQGWYSSYR